METVKEGSRWRYARPSAEEVAEWFATQPIDEGMNHEDYVGGVVLIPANEKVKHPKEDGDGTEEIWEQTFTPYVRVDTRDSYFRKLAEIRDLIAVIEPVVVPQIKEGWAKNDHMAPGFWWLAMGAGNNMERFLCATWKVALYDKVAYFASDEELGRRGMRRVPIREGVATKAVYGSPDIDAPARAETGAIGRALGVAGILVVGSGIATAEDMAEVGAPKPVGPTLPDAAPGDDPEALNERLLLLQEQLKPYAEQWRAFAAWWKERQEGAGWKSLNDAPIEVRRGMATKMQGLIAEAEQAPAPPPDSSPSVMPSVDGDGVST